MLSVITNNMLSGRRFSSTSSPKSVINPVDRVSRRAQKVSPLPFSKESKRSKRRVGFDISCNQVHVIQPLFEHTAELWWSKEELGANKVEQANQESKIFNKDDVVEYMNTYCNSRRDVSRVGKLSLPTMEKLISARLVGLEGLERYSPTLSKKRDDSIRRSIASIVNQSKSTKRKRSKEANVAQLAQYAKNLSKFDCDWATVSAKVDAAVVASIYNERN